MWPQSSRLILKVTRWTLLVLKKTAQGCGKSRVCRVRQTWRWIPAGPYIAHGIFGKAFELFELPCPHLWSEVKNACLIWSVHCLLRSVQPMGGIDELSTDALFTFLVVCVPGWSVILLPVLCTECSWPLIYLTSIYWILIVCQVTMPAVEIRHYPQIQGAHGLVRVSG